MFGQIDEMRRRRVEESRFIFYGRYISALMAVFVAGLRPTDTAVAAVMDECSGTVSAMRRESVFLGSALWQYQRLHIELRRARARVVFAEDTSLVPILPESVQKRLVATTVPAGLREHLRHVHGNVELTVRNLSLRRRQKVRA